MTTLFYTAKDIMEILGVSKTKAYSIISELNQQLVKDGYLVVAGKVSKAYFHKRFYGFQEDVNTSKELAG